MRNEERKKPTDRNFSKTEDPLSRLSFRFALRIVKLFRYLQTTHKEYILSKQVLRSGTAIGALIREAKYAQSRADFLHKLSIALKEANETKYWLELLYHSDYLELVATYKSILPDIESLIKLLIASTKTAKENL